MQNTFPERMVRCPYCNEPFRIALRAKDGSSLYATGARRQELYVLPYARDVDLFDPDPRDEGRKNSDFTRIGTDFFGGLNYERIGILHIERGWDVRYSVARCTKCEMLMDVFLNLTDEKPLSEMWPHLLTQHGGRIVPWQPRSFLSRAFGEPLLMFMFFTMLLASSVVPKFFYLFQQPILDVEVIREEVLPILSVRGIVATCALILIILRARLIAVFSDYNFAKLLNVNPALVAYWSNFAVCRFTGYQREGRALSFNAVMVIGGFSSTIVLAVAVIYVWYGQLGDVASYPELVAGPAVFWFVTAYIHGTLMWSFTVIPVYVFRGLKNVPLRIDDYGGEISEFWRVKRAGKYAVGGVAVVTAGAIALSVMPVFVAPFRELSVAIIWAQGALIVCFSVLIIRFGIRGQADPVKKSVGGIEIILVLALFVVARAALGVGEEGGLAYNAARWLRLGDLGTFRKYGELALFSIIAGYLFYRLAGDVMRGVIRETYRKNRLRWLSEPINRTIGDKDVEGTEKILRAPPLWKRSENPKTIEWIALLFAAAGTAVSMVDLALKYMMGGD